MTDPNWLNAMEWATIFLLVLAVAVLVFDSWRQRKIRRLKREWEAQHRGPRKRVKLIGDWNGGEDAEE